MDSSSTNSNGFPPCDKVNGTITAIVLRLTPNLRAGSTNLKFTLRYLVPTGDPNNYSLSNVCQGTTPGSQCQVLPQDLIITFDTTQLFAAYSLEQLPYGIPYCYAVSQSPALLNLTSSANSCGQGNYACAGYVDCNSAKQLVDLGPYYQSAGLFARCPLQSAIPDAKVAQYYTGPDGSSIGENNLCSALLCRTPVSNEQPNGRVTSIIETQGPVCSVWNIQANPSAAMNIRITVTYGNVVKKLVLSTEQGNTISAIENLLFAQIIRTGFGAGVVAPSLPGQLLTCANCAPTDPACNSIPFDDLPPAPGDTDGFTLYNPWSTSKNKACSLPLAACRAAFQIPGQPASGRWFYLSPVRTISTALGVCNSNAFWSYDALAGQATNAAGLQQRICANILSSQGTCIPGLPQPIQFALPRQPITYTPSLMEQLFATRVSCYIDNHECTAQVDFLPLDYNVRDGLSQYFFHKGRYYRNALNTADSQGEVEMVLYAAQDFLGQVITIVAGQFVEGTVLCSGNQNTEGSTFYQVQNLNLTSAGQFSVCATYTLPPDADKKHLTLYGPSTRTNGTSATICQMISVAAGGTQAGLFNYVYDGNLGSNSLLVTLVLSATAASQTYDFSTISTSCSTVAGVAIVPNFYGYADHPEDNPAIATSRVCHWYDLLCFNGAVWQTIIKVILWLLVVAILVYASYSLCTCYRAQRKVRKTASAQKTTVAQRQQRAAMRAQEKQNSFE